jgi:hypothetical protein
MGSVPTPSARTVALLEQDIDAFLDQFAVDLLVEERRPNVSTSRV